MGQVPGQVAVAAFGVFNPKLMVAAVVRGWSIAGVDDVLAARERGATAALQRIVGEPDGLRRATELLAQAAAGGCAARRSRLTVPRRPSATSPTRSGGAAPTSCHWQSEEIEMSSTTTASEGTATVNGATARSR